MRKKDKGREGKIFWKTSSFRSMESNNKKKRVKFENDKNVGYKKSYKLSALSLRVCSQEEKKNQKILFENYSY